MNILVIGSGGREHAIAWKLAQSQHVQRVFVSPGNAGCALENKLENVVLKTHQDYANFAKNNNIAFTVVGPEAPLSEGIVDFFQQENLPIFGPSQQAAQLETSKNFAKEFMAKNNIPTANFQSFNNKEDAHAYVEQQGAPIVIKQDGLAAGKGVVVAETLNDAHRAIDELFQDNQMLVIEEFLQGQEASFIVMCDGNHVLPFATSQDHKRIFDHDQGPNTGGMGAYSPAPIVSDLIYQKAMNQIILPSIAALKQNGTPFVGFLYAGLMITPDHEVKTLEFNCRLGDPETQPILMRLKSDFADLITAALKGKLNECTVQWDERAALGVVLAAKNYPFTPQKGDVITGIPQNNAFADDVHVFHAGTKKQNNQILTDGGRVLCVVALGENIQQAQQKAYDFVPQINWPGMQYRKDIGNKAI